MTANLRDLLAAGKNVPAPGATDALSARLIEAHGYKCVYIGSYTTAGSRFAIPDTGRLSLEQLVSQAKTIADAVRAHRRGQAHERSSNSVPRGRSRQTDPPSGCRAQEPGLPCRGALRRLLGAPRPRGPDMVFPTMVGQRELDEVRRRIGKPIISIARQFEALQRALSSGNLASDIRPLEDFLGYKDAPGRSSNQ